MRGRHAQAQAGHAIKLGERAQHDQVIALRHLRDQARLLAVLQVGLVDQYAGGRRLVGQQPGELIRRADRAGRVVRVAHIQQAGRARVCGGHHRAQVMCAVVVQWHFLHVRTVCGRDLAQRLEGRIGDYQSRLRAGPQHGGTVQRFAGTRIEPHVIGRNARLFDEGVAHLTGQCETVAAATGDAVACRLLGCGRGAVGAFVEIQQHRTFGGARGDGCRGLGMAGPRQPAAGDGEAGSGQLQEASTGSGRGHGQDSEGQTVAR